MLLWLVTNAQAGGRKSVLPSNSSSHRAAGSQEAEPSAPAYSTTGTLELNSTTAGGWQLLHGQHLLWEKQHQSPGRAVRISLSPDPVQALSPYLLALLTLKEEALVLLDQCVSHIGLQVTKSDGGDQHCASS